MSLFFYILLTFSFIFLIFPHSALAVCPICTLAVGAGLGLSRWIGIDDTITGIWIGGLVLSSGIWLSSWISKKGINFPHRDFFSVLVILFLVIVPLYFSSMIGIPGNTFWGVDKILLGSIFGFFAFLLGIWLDNWLRTKNNGKFLFYYQKVIVPVFLLAFVSFVFYFLTL